MAGRKHKQIEFIQLLAELLELDDHATNFAKRINKKVSNVSKYLSGKLVPGNKVLESAVRHAYEWDVRVIAEIAPVETHANSLPREPGIYSLYDSSGSAIYVGQATNLRVEVAQALQRLTNFPVRLGPKLSKMTHRKYKSVAKYFSAYEVPSRRVRHNLEALLLRVFPNQSHNNKMGNFM